MAGFASFIGGAGGAAHDFGQQIRGILEQRRGHFADLLTGLASNEIDPQRKAAYLSHASDLISGKDMSKVAPAVLKTLQDHTEGNHALSQLVGGPPPPPKSTPGPAAPGKTPGTDFSAAQPGFSPVQSAAQPSTSPVQPQQQPTPTIPPINNWMPESISGRPTSDLMQTGVGRALLQPFLTNEAERQRTASMLDMTAKNRRAVIDEDIKRSKEAGVWDKLSPRMQAEMFRGATNLTPERVPLQVSRPISTPPGAIDTEGKPITTQQVIMRHYTDGTTEYYPVPDQMGTGYNREGEQLRVPKLGAAGSLTGAVAAPVVGANVTPHSISTPQGLRMLTAPQINQGNYQDPRFASVVRSSSVSQGANGETITNSESHRVLPGVAITPPTGPKSPSTPKVVKPFDDSDRIDHILRLVGQDSTNKKFLTSRDAVPFGKRMAELGIDPNNITTSLRERSRIASLVLDHVAGGGDVPYAESVRGILDKAEKDGDIGLVASRWNDFLTGKLVGKDYSKTQVFSKLQANYDFLTSAAAMMHGGVRAASSPNMMEHWTGVLDAKDPATLRSKLSAVEAWAKGYKGLIPSKDQVINPVGHNPAVEELVKKYGGR